MPTIPNGPGNPKHIGDLLDQQGVSWSYYSENLVAAEALCDAGQNYRPTGWNPHMQPFNHFSTFASQTSSYWTTHQKDGLTQFFPALNASTLEAVTWYRPESTYCYGFGNASPAVAAQWMDAFVANITATQLWQQNKLMVSRRTCAGRRTRMTGAVLRARCAPARSCSSTSSESCSIHCTHGAHHRPRCAVRR